MSEERDRTITPRLGMWLFLFSELILFSGLFLLYGAAMRRYPLEFHKAANEMNVFFGGLNTMILLSSSFSIALSVNALKKGQAPFSKWFLLCTVLLACFFLGNKYLEWTEKIHHGIYPNSPELQGLPKGEILFFNLYYIMTGLHGLHVAIGAILFIVVFFLIRDNRISSSKPAFIENCGLYWHLVDIIWIYLFPLFYLIT